MPNYVAEYHDDLQKSGPEKFLRLHPNPVFIVQGLAGELKDERAKGATVVTTASDVVLLSTLVGRVLPVVKSKYSPPGPIVIGRTSDNDLAIPEYSISKKHCVLAKVGDEMRLTDCGSTNGTLVNGVQLEANKPYTLLGGEKVTMGRFALLFHLPQGFVEYLKNRK
jgi:hypothetical protein